MSEQQEPKTFEADGTRPIESGDIKVADTFEEDGTRPIAESPDFLVSERAKPGSEADRHTQNNNLDNPQKTTDTLNIVDTFEADGERPIMANKYEVVDTINIDGERPITRSNNG